MTEQVRVARETRVRAQARAHDAGVSAGADVDAREITRAARRAGDVRSCSTGMALFVFPSAGVSPSTSTAPPSPAPGTLGISGIPSA